jgi:hypothetical protein
MILVFSCKVAAETRHVSVQDFVRVVGHSYIGPKVRYGKFRGVEPLPAKLPIMVDNADWEAYALPESIDMVRALATTWLVRHLVRRFTVNWLS